MNMQIRTKDQEQKVSPEQAIENERAGRRERVTLQSDVDASGEFEIACSTAGTGSGWEFKAPVLEASLSLWNGVDCFVDHSWGGHSVKDLAGRIHSPAWNAELSGITAKLKPAGPNKELVEE